ncbi:uncharacterized protein LOC130679227 [Manis pentadactyla]|uniref:uncharacterized protein LOC130679227 n=1 Tax=Manis pentadactyla TaxID=143292 RepID=UPI00255C5D53|nr:uncharacterized protein LOC130679227 [Manis pentadactyla]
MLSASAVLTAQLTAALPLCVDLGTISDYPVSPLQVLEEGPRLLSLDTGHSVVHRGARPAAECSKVEPEVMQSRGEVSEMKKLRQGFCDFPGITQFNWTPNFEVPSSSGITPDGSYLLSSAPVLLNHRQICLPGDIWQYLEVFWLSQLEEGSRVEVLLASRGWRPRMPLNILQHTDPQKKPLTPNGSSVEAEKPWSMLCCASEGNSNLWSCPALPSNRLGISPVAATGAKAAL